MTVQIIAQQLGDDANKLILEFNKLIEITNKSGESSGAVKAIASINDLLDADQLESSNSPEKRAKLARC